MTKATHRFAGLDGGKIGTEIVPWGQRSHSFSFAAAMRALGPVVYAVRTRDGLIKIGFSTDLASRRKSLRVAELLAVKPGTLDEEQVIHARLAEYVDHGREWYPPVPAVLAVVNELRDYFGMGPLSA